MAVDQSLVGRTFPLLAAYDVTAEKVAVFAVTVGQGRRDEASVGASWREPEPAPPTFPIVVAFAAMQQLMQDPDVGIELSHVIHGDQKFVHHRTVHVGDTLSTSLTVNSLRQIAGADIIRTTSVITDAAGEPVCDAIATLVHR